MICFQRSCISEMSHLTSLDTFVLWFVIWGLFLKHWVLDKQLHKSPLSIQELLRSLLGIPPHVIGPQNQGIAKVGYRKAREVLPIEKPLPRNTALSSEWFVIEIVAETILNRCTWKSEMHSNEYCNFKHVWVTWHVWTPLFFDFSFWSCFWNIAVCTNTYVNFPYWYKSCCNRCWVSRRRSLDHKV